jgi:hypothetical protein
LELASLRSTSSLADAAMPLPAGLNAIPDTVGSGQRATAAVSFHKEPGSALAA